MTEKGASREAPFFVKRSKTEEYSVITITLPASTANLGPAFDSMGLALTCYNTIAFELTKSGLTIDLDERDRGTIPSDGRNLIYRVFSRTLNRFGVKVPGIRFRQGNDIPAMRGMGSSSACVVGGVAMANYVMGDKLSRQDIINMCALEEGHPDNILPTVLGGVVAGCIDGEHVHYVRMDPPKNLKCAVFVPPFSLSTRKARAALPQSVPLKDAVFNLSHAALLSAAMCKGDLGLLKIAMQDRLHQPYRKPLIPEYDAVQEIALNCGALAVCLSGAGPTIIAFLDGDNGFADAVRPQLSGLTHDWALRVLDVDTKGYTIG